VEAALKAIAAPRRRQIPSERSQEAEFSIDASDPAVMKRWMGVDT
jgi:hypothetical protein